MPNPLQLADAAVAAMNGIIQNLAALNQRMDVHAQMFARLEAQLARIATAQERALAADDAASSPPAETAGTSSGSPTAEPSAGSTPGVSGPT